jgi:hypothetical protein
LAKTPFGTKAKRSLPVAASNACSMPSFAPTYMTAGRLAYWAANVA